jgi:hypothetical protein
MTTLNDKEQTNITKLLQENLALTKEVHQLTVKVKKYIIWAQIIGIVKVILILAPIIFAVIYLPPFLRQAFSGYTNTLNLDTNQFNSILPSK